MSSAYLRLLIFLPAILIPACASSSPAFQMMNSAYKLNKQGDNIQPWRTPFPAWNESVFPRPVLTVASWPVYRFLRRQVRWSRIPISFRIFHHLLWSTQWRALEIKQKLLGAALGITDKMEVRPQPLLLIIQAQSRDEGVRSCDSDLFFPFFSWVGCKEC